MENPQEADELRGTSVEDDQVTKGPLAPVVDELQITKNQLVALAHKTKQLLAVNQQLRAERDASELKVGKFEQLLVANAEKDASALNLETASLVIHTPTSPLAPEDATKLRKKENNDVVVVSDEEFKNLRQQLVRLQEQDTFLRVQLQHQDSQITQKSRLLSACEQQKTLIEQQSVALTTTLATKNNLISTLEQTLSEQTQKCQQLTNVYELLQSQHNVLKMQQKTQQSQEVTQLHETIRDLELKLQEKETRLLSLSESSHLHQEEMSTYRAHVDDLTQTVTSMRAELKEASEKTQYLTTMQQASTEKESQLRSKLSQSEAQLTFQSSQHLEVLGRLRAAASEEKNMMVEELLREKESAQGKEKELAELKELLAKTKTKLRDTLGAHLRVEAEARTKNDLLLQLENDLKEAQQRLAGETENLRKALTKILKLQKHAKEVEKETKAREQQLFDKKFEQEQAISEQRAHIAILEKRLGEQETVIATLENDQKEARRELLLKATALEVLEREVVKMTGVLCGLQNQKRELVGTLQRALKR